MTLAKQFDFRVAGRGVLVDPTLPATPANLSFIIDTVTIDGTQYPAASMDSTSITNMAAAVETVVQLNNHTSQTITLTSASIGAGQTMVVTVGSPGVTGTGTNANARTVSTTYTNGTGSAVVQTAGALAAAFKTSADADPVWSSLFDTTVSGSNLVISQKGNHTKWKLAVVTGTGTLTTITVA
jgi:hypothetical protein